MTDEAILLTPGRAGSFLLTDLVGQHPDVTVDFEPLRERADEPDRVLEDSYAAAATGGSAVWWWAVHPSHFDVNGMDGRQHVASALDRGARVVTLVRNNPVEQALSSFVAVGKRQGHVADVEKHGAVHVDPAEFVAKIELAVRETALVHEMAGLSTHLALFYEDDLRDPSDREATLQRIWHFLGLRPAAVRPNVRRRTIPLADQVTNWEELRALLGRPRYRDWRPD